MMKQGPGPTIQVGPCRRGNLMPLQKDRKPPTAVPRLSIFDRTADRVSFFMGTPTNIGIWIVLVVA